MYRFRTLALVAAAIVTLPLADAVAQVTLPVENHYTVYAASPPYAISRPIGLRDQFGTYQVLDMWLDRFANPAEKRITEADGTVRVYPIVNPEVHMNWWRLFISLPLRDIIITDQFGTHKWFVGDAVFLLTPALKNPQPGVPPLPPKWNHYLCYNAGGPDQPIPVIVTDQFGTRSFSFLMPYVFCNPVEKTDGGVVYPIEDPAAHLAVYQVFPGGAEARSIITVDQFGTWDRDVTEFAYLCVPALKEFPVGTSQSTWGKIKALYR